MKITEAQDRLNKCSHEVLPPEKTGWFPFHSQPMILVMHVDIESAIDICEIEGKSDEQIKTIVVERVFNNIVNKLKKLPCCLECGRYLKKDERCFCWNDE